MPGLRLFTGFPSNGNATPEALDFIRPVTDCYKIDLKTIDDRRYRRLGGVLAHVLDAIGLVHERAIWLEVLTLVVPGFWTTRPSCTRRRVTSRASAEAFPGMSPRFTRTTASGAWGTRRPTCQGSVSAPMPAICRAAARSSPRRPEPRHHRVSTSSQIPRSCTRLDRVEHVRQHPAELAVMPVVHRLEVDLVAVGERPDEVEGLGRGVAVGDEPRQEASRAGEREDLDRPFGRDERLVVASSPSASRPRRRPSSTSDSASHRLPRGGASSRSDCEVTQFWQ